jgi:hypothetical protein
LVKLGASEELLSKYQVLRKEDLKVSTTVIDVRLPSRADSTLPWFWNMDVERDTMSDTWMAKCKSHFSQSSWSFSSNLSTILVYRVHWLRAKAKLDRAREETIILQYEMDWTLQYFRKQGQVWMERKTKAQESIGGSNQTSGAVCYAFRQADMWKMFEEKASSKFSDCMDSILV